jgi:hypothetical protein
MPTAQTIGSGAFISGIYRLDSFAWISGQRQQLKSTSFISEPATSIICDGHEVDNIINEFGTYVVVRVVSKSTDTSDEYGTSTETTSDVRKKAMVLRYSANDNDVREGVFKAGEIIFSFPIGDKNIIIPGNRIIYAGVLYEIREIVQQPLVDTLYYLQARVEKK